jgi:hypothetical protein
MQSMAYPMNGMEWVVMDCIILDWNGGWIELDTLLCKGL